LRECLSRARPHATAKLTVQAQGGTAGQGSTGTRDVGLSNGRGRAQPCDHARELDSVQEAPTPKVGFDGVATHRRAAVALLGKRPEPDYRNSIKESISAVEAGRPGRAIV
jgi:hypothetical protein